MPNWQHELEVATIAARAAGEAAMKFFRRDPRVTIKADRSLALGNDPIPPAGLAAALDTATKMDRQQRLFLRADKSVPYGDVMGVMNLLRAAGYLKVALVGLEGVDGAGEPPPAPAPVSAPPRPTP